MSNHNQSSSTAVSDRTADALDLMERVLRDGRSMGAEYPLVFGERAASGEVEIIEHAGAPASTCAWLRRDLVTPTVSVPAALIGSVATVPSARGLGLGSQVVDRAIERAAEAGAAVALLWADDPHWYQERGWVAFGTETLYVIEESWAFLLPDPVGVRVATPNDAEAIHALYAEHTSRVARTLDETRAVLGVPAMRSVVFEREGRVTGYACMGRGEDLINVVHEWSGDAESVLTCFAKLWAEADTERLFVMLAETEIDLLAYFRFVKAPGASGILAMSRIASIDAMRDVFDAATPADVTVTVAPCEEPALDLRSPDGALRLTGHEILLALCPPRGDRRVTDVVEQELVRPLPALPVQPFVWGLDSI